MGERLSRRQRIAYVSPGLTLTIALLPLYVFVPRFYVDVVGIPVAAVGAVVLLGQLFDAFTDPWIGGLSDRVRTRWGRRRPLIGIGCVPLAVCFVLLCSPPQWNGGPALAWFACSLLGVYLFWTVVVVPYEALGIEITSSYDERTAVLGLRECLALLGILMAVATPPLLGTALELPDSAAGERRKFFLFAMLFAPVIAVSCMACVLMVKEPAVPAREPRVANWTLSFRILRDNRPFRTLLLAFSFATMASSVPAVTILFYARVVLQIAEPEWLLLVYVGSGIVCAPFWLWLAQRWEKRSVWMLGLATNAAGHALAWPLGSGSPALSTLVILLIGAPFGALVSLPSSMQADAVDHGAALHGSPDAGVHVGLWNLVRKIAGGVAAAGALWCLGATGYDPSFEPDDEVRTGLRVVFCLAPLALNSASLWWAYRYPIDRAAHAQLLR